MPVVFFLYWMCHGGVPDGWFDFDLGMVRVLVFSMALGVALPFYFVVRMRIASTSREIVSIVAGMPYDARKTVSRCGMLAYAVRAVCLWLTELVVYLIGSCAAAIEAAVFGRMIVVHEYMMVFMGFPLGILVVFFAWIYSVGVERDFYTRYLDGDLAMCRRPVRYIVIADVLAGIGAVIAAIFGVLVFLLMGNFVVWLTF